MQEETIIRCPKCGSVHLTGVYQKASGKKALAKSLLLGWIGMIWSLFDACKKEKNYWKCLNCGYQFEMK